MEFLLFSLDLANIIERLNMIELEIELDSGKWNLPELESLIAKVESSIKCSHDFSCPNSGYAFFNASKKIYWEHHFGTQDNSKKENYIYIEIIFINLK